MVNFHIALRTTLAIANPLNFETIQLRKARQAFSRNYTGSPLKDEQKKNLCQVDYNENAYWIVAILPVEYELLLRVQNEIHDYKSEDLLII